MGAVQSVYGALLPPPEPPASPQQPGSSGGSAGTMFSDAGDSSFGSAELAHACAMDEQQVRGATISDRDLCMGVIACIAQGLPHHIWGWMAVFSGRLSCQEASVTLQAAPQL